MKNRPSLQKIYEAQDCSCFYCNRPIEPWPEYKHNKNGYTKDHFVPKSRLGNKKLLFNIVLSHKKCNSIKSNRYPNRTEIMKFKQVYIRAIQEEL